MKNRKGFTLVELLVTVLILGIVTGLSIPLIRNVQNNNKNREYIAYMDTMKYSAKLYVDSYGEDLFGKRKTGCTIIKYSDLYGKGLLKDIPVDKVSCASDDSFVKVVKLDDKYGYSTAIGCGYVNAGGNVIINTNLSNTGNIVTKTCNLEAKVIMDFQAVPEESLSVKYKKRNIKLTISSDTGFNDDMQIYYGFSYNQDSNVIDNNWRKLPIKASGKRSQKEKILSGEAISITTDDLTTPAGVTGKLYLVIRVDKLENLVGEPWTRDKDIESFQSFGPYIVDNTKPEFNDSTIISSEATYNSVKPKLNLKVTDNLSKSEDLKMCISYNRDSCSKKVSDMKNGVGYEAYRTDRVLNPIKNVHDGSNHTIFVTVADKAGNYDTKSFNYELGCSITYDKNGGVGQMPDTICNKNVDCPLKVNAFTRERHDFDGWYTSATGGTKYGASVKLTTNITVYAHWKLMEHKITFNVNGGDAWTKGRCEATTGGVFNNGTCYKLVREQANYGALPVSTRNNVYFDRWTTASNGGTTINSNTKFTGTTDQTLYAQYGICTAARYVTSGKTIVRWISGNASTNFSEFAIGCEHFYVIGTSGDTVIGLAKYNLNLENNSQSQNGFQLTNTSLGGYTAYNEAKAYCNGYGSLLNDSYGLSGIGSGMMTRALLANFCSNICYNCYMRCSNSKLYSSYYWGLTVSKAEYGCGKSWCGAERGLRIYSDGQTDVPATNPASNRPGVRPIITINKYAIN